jgi:hypothetical protein
VPRVLSPRRTTLLGLARLLCVLTLTLPLAAQTTQTGMLEGRVIFANGRAIANATVTARQSDGSFERTTRTDALGDFRLNFLTPGRYTVSVRQLGFADATVPDIAVRATDVQRITVTLVLAQAELAPVTVRATPPAPSKSNSTEFTRSLQARERELLPAPRNANALIGLLPGLRPGQVYGGSTGQANLYQLDGVTVNQPGRGGSFLLPNVDWIEDIRVIGPGAGAEYGNFQGGLINIVTKSGSNTTQGQLRTFFENRALNATNVNAFESGSELDARLEVSGELRGPILRDRLYYFVSGQEARGQERVIDLPNASATELAWLPTRTERREQTYYGKLTLQANDRDVLNASVGIDRLTRERIGLSAFTSAEATYRGTSPSVFYQANWLRTVNNRSAFEIKLSGFTGRDDELPYGGASLPSVQLLDAANTPQFVNATYSNRNTPSSLGVSTVWSAFANTAGVQHHIKTGGEFVFGEWREARTRNGGLSWYTEAGEGFDPRNPATWREIPSLGVYATADTGGRIDLDAATQNGALFVQDDMRITDHLSISAGLRLSRWAGTITPGNGGSARGRERFEALSASGLDPRLGATLDLFGTGSLVAKAHWGRFHQNLFALFFDRAPGSNVFTDIGYCDWRDTDRRVLPELGRNYSPSAFNVLFDCFPGVNLQSEVREIRDYRQPHVDQITLGVEKTLGRHLRADALYINRRNRAVLSVVDLRETRNWSPVANVRIGNAQGPLRDPDGRDVVLPQVFVRNDDLRARLAAGDFVPGYNALDTLALEYAPDLVLQPVDDARRDFQQLQLTLAGTYPRVSFTAALSYTALSGNVFSVNGYAQPSGEGIGPYVAPNARLNMAGNLPNFAPWDFRLRMTGQLPWGVEGGGFLTYSSGDFWTPTLDLSRQLTYAVDAVDGAISLDRQLFRNANGQSVFVESRGSRQLASRHNLDVRLQKVLALRRHDVIVGLEVFNVFNANAITTVNEQLNAQAASDPSSLAGAARFRQPPTTFRLNLQYRL